VLANSPFAYKAFYDDFGNSQYANAALKMQNAPKLIPLMQATKLIVSPQLAPNLKQPTNFGLPKDGIKIGENNGQRVGGGKITTLPVIAAPRAEGLPDKKIVTLPANSGGRITSGQAKVDVKTSMPVNRVTNTRPQLNSPMTKLNNKPLGNRFNQGNSQPARMSFGGNNGASRMAMGGGQMRRGF
jgi:hypothetical protein